MGLKAISDINQSEMPILNNSIPPTLLIVCNQ